jgi:hypothetical protein
VESAVEAPSLQDLSEDLPEERTADSNLPAPEDSAVLSEPAAAPTDEATVEADAEHDSNDRLVGAPKVLPEPTDQPALATADVKATAATVANDDENRSDVPTDAAAQQSEEERLERLRAEKKALQDKLETKKGSQKDGKKPANETAEQQPASAETAVDAAASPTPPIDKAEPRSPPAGKDAPSSTLPPPPLPPPAKPAAPSSETEQTSTEGSRSGDELSADWDLESVWEAAVTIAESWSSWWQELFVTGQKDEDGSDVKWTSGEDSIVERKELDDRFNYAGFDVGARVLQAHKKTKGARNTLMWDVDQYMNSPCSLKKKWVVLQLSEPLLVEKIMLANFEQYASTFRHFQVLGSAIYPVNVPGGPGGWKLLGSFVAKDNNNAQDFMLKTPQWAKYLKVRFLSHYGHEHYCTVSSIKVFGTNMLEDMQRQEMLDKQRKEDAAEALDEAGPGAAAKEGAGNVLALGSSAGAGTGGQAAVAGSSDDGSAPANGDGSQDQRAPSQVVSYDLNKLATQNRVDASKCMVVPWTISANQMSPAPECYQSTSIQVAPGYSSGSVDMAAAKAAAAGSNAAHAAAQAALAGAQAAADADENPFRAMTNKIRLLELNHSATVLLVERLEAQNAVVLNEVQRTQAARDEAVLAAETLLSEHSAKVEADHREMRELVQRDAIGTRMIYRYIISTTQPC